MCDGIIHSRDLTTKSFLTTTGSIQRSALTD
jgi:hypothetical protein